MKKFYILLLTVGTSYMNFGQVGVGTLTPNSSSQLDIVSENKGILIPRVSLKSSTDSTTISNGNINSLLVFNTETIGDLVPGFYYWYTDKWIRIGSDNKLVPTTNLLTYSNNAITSIVNEQGATAKVINSVSNDLRGKELVTTINGVESNTLDLSPLLNNNVLATNGLISKDAKIELGGNLIKPTVITTTSSNTLALHGLQIGNSSYIYDGNNYTSTADRILVSDPVTGLLKQVKSTMPKFFYAPSVIIPTHDQNGIVLVGTQTLDAYNLYVQQFGFKGTIGQARSNSTSSLPVLASNDLDYFITYYDSTIFQTVTITPQGLINYTINPSAAITEASFINIVFKVKD